ncbi:MAG: AAA family ATPase [Shimia sp.]
MQRVMIVGQPGSGKSTLARLLGERTGLPVVHLDHIHWKAGWVSRPMAEKLPMVRAAEAEPRWIIEGGLSATYDTRLARADYLVWIDIPVPLRLWRVTERFVRYHGKTRPDLPKGCPERFGWHTLEFYVFILRTARTSWRKIVELFEGYGGPKVRLRSLRQVDAWLDNLP